MDQGNWVAITKAIVKSLPHGRKFSEADAIISLSVSYDNESFVSEASLAKTWLWSRYSVRKLLDKLDLELTGEKTTNKINQIIKIKKTGKKTGKGQVRIIDGKGYSVKKDSKKTGKKTLYTDPLFNTDPKYTENSNEFRLSFYLLNHIKKHSPKIKEPDLQKWFIDSEYILRLDKRDIEECKKLIKFIHGSDEMFYRNVLSISKFRKRYDEIKVGHDIYLSKKNSNQSKSNEIPEELR